MSSRQTLFRVFYRLGFVPWDGHSLAKSMRDLVEGDAGIERLHVAGASQL